MDSNKLLAFIKLKGFQMSKFLELIQMPSSTWSKKIRGISEFTRAEICAIISILKLTNQEVMDIFFTHKVS